MAGVPILPDSLIERLAEMHCDTNPATGRRWTLRELAEVASRQLPEGTDVSHMAVQRAIKPLLEERAQITREALRAKITERVNAQIDSLDDLITKVAANAMTATPMVQRKGLDSLAKAIGMKLRHSGVDDRAELNLSGTPQGVADFLGLAFGPGGRETPS